MVRQRIQFIRQFTEAGEFAHFPRGSGLWILRSSHVVFVASVTADGATVCFLGPKTSRGGPRSAVRQLAPQFVVCIAVSCGKHMSYAPRPNHHHHTPAPTSTSTPPHPHLHPHPHPHSHPRTPPPPSPSCLGSKWLHASGDHSTHRNPSCWYAVACRWRQRSRSKAA